MKGHTINDFACRIKNGYMMTAYVRKIKEMVRIGWSGLETRQPIGLNIKAKSEVLWPNYRENIW